jgi:uncharacterized membrane protein
MQYHELITQFVFLMGFIMLGFGITEIIVPVRTFALWKRWTAHRLFYLHGLLLIAVGFPLTLYENPDHPFLANTIFVIGLIAVFSGPILLLYPEKIGNLFQHISEEIETRSVKRIIYADAILRILIGSIFIYSTHF